MCAISLPLRTRKAFFFFAFCSAKPAARWVGPILAKVAIFFSPLYFQAKTRKQNSLNYRQRKAFL